MTVQATIHVEGVCDTLADLQAAVAYLQNHADIVEFSYDEGTLLVSGTSITFPWQPEPVADPPA